MSPEAQSKLQERGAYHEAGHMVAAADQELVFGPRGLRIDSVGQGICFYDKQPQASDDSRERLIVAAQAGYISNQHFEHNCPEWMAYVDFWEVNGLLQAMLTEEPKDLVQQRLWRRAKEIIEKRSAIIERLAGTLLSKEWMPREALNLKEDWSQGWEEKRMGGEEAASLLRTYGLPNAISRG